MTDKELRRLSRKDLLQIMIMQQKKVDSLSAELVKAKEEIEKRKIMKEKAGSIAEASLGLNKVFEAAQKAADQYLENIKQMEVASKQYCLNICLNTRNKCNELSFNTKRRINNLLKDLQVELGCRDIITSELDALLEDVEKFEV